MKEKWQNLSKGKKTWVIIGAIVILAVATAPFRDTTDEPAEAQAPEPTATADEEPSEEASEEPETPAVDVDEIMQTWLDTYEVDEPSELLSDDQPNIWGAPAWAISDWEPDGETGMSVYVAAALTETEAQHIAVSIFQNGARDHPRLVLICVYGVDSAECTARSKALPDED